MKKQFKKAKRKHHSPPSSKVITPGPPVLTRVQKYGNGLFAAIQLRQASELGIAQGDHLSIRILRGGIYIKRLSTAQAAELQEGSQRRAARSRNGRGDGSYANAKQLPLLKDAA